MAEKLLNEDVNTTVKTEADVAVERAIKMFDAGMKAREKRFKDIKKNEDAYNGITSSAIRGRSNIPFDCVVMGGFIDTLMANVDEPIALNFGRKREQDKMSSDKVTAVWEIESAPDKGDWDGKTMDTKLLAALSGRAFIKEWSDSVNGFRNHFEVVDHYDMVVENKTGDIDLANYKFQQNIFRSRQDLLQGVMEGWYDRQAVHDIFISYNDPELFKKSQEAATEQASRYSNFGMEIGTDYIGTKLYRFIEGAVYMDGKWMYILFSKEACKAIRYCPLEEVCPHAAEHPGKALWASAATNPHPFIFWTKAPADDIRPIGVTMKKTVNTMLDANTKNTYDMTAYDPRFFKSPTDLLWREDGLVRATPPQGRQISEGLYKFTTRDSTTVSINLVQWMDNFLGQKTGITADAQGTSKEDRVGILYSNLQQVSKRMMLTNKRFNSMYVSLGIMFDHGLYKCLREPMAVKLIGNDGINWDEEVTTEDAEKDFSISVLSGLQETQKNMVANQKKGEGFKQIAVDPILKSKINGEWYAREYLKWLGYTDEQVRVAMDINNGGSDEVLAHAAQAIQDCLEGKEYIQLYRGATFAFVEKILNFAADKFPLIPDDMVAQMSGSKQKKYQEDMKKYDRLVAHAQKHVPIAQENAQRALVQTMTINAMSNPGAPNGGPAGAPNGQPVNPQETALAVQ